MAEIVSDELMLNDRLTDEDVQGILTTELNDAIDFIDNTISPARAESEKMYLGDPSVMRKKAAPKSYRWM